MSRIARLGVSFVLALAFFPATAMADKKVALVVGINRYTNLGADLQLQKAVNDANAVGDALEKDGFEVVRGSNLSRSEIVDKLFELSKRIEPGDTAFFYFAGHGIALGGGNYILPADIPPAEQGQESRIANQSLAEADIVASLQEKGTRISIVVLDACRDNPFKRPGVRSVGLDRGLARMPEAKGLFSLYSAGFGQTALDRLSDDDKNPNSVFTRVLVPLLTKPGLNLDDLAFEVKEEVAKLAETTPDHHDQIPAAYNQIVGGRVFLAGLSPTEATPKKPPALLPPEPPQPGPDSSAWSLIQGTTDPKLVSLFIARFPNSPLRQQAETLLASLEPPPLVKPLPQPPAVVPPAAVPPQTIAPQPDAVPRPAQSLFVMPPGAGLEFWGGGREGSPVVSVAASPDGRFAVVGTGGSDRSLKLWDLSKGSLVKVLAGHSNSVEAVAFSRDGRFIASGGDTTIKLWDVASGSLIRSFEHGESVYAIAFSPDGRSLLSGGSDKTVKLWDVASGGLTRSLAGHRGSVHAVAFSPDGRTIASGGYEEGLKLWDAATGRLVRSYGRQLDVAALAFSPDGRTIVTGGEELFRLWDVASGRQIRNFAVTNGITSVAFAPDGRSIASGGYDHAITLWDAGAGTPIRTFTGHATSVGSVAFTPDGRSLISGSPDDTARLWDTGSGRLVATFVASTSDWAALADDGRYVASGDLKKLVALTQGSNVLPLDDFILRNRRDALSDLMSAR